jgi:hypothetical protein
MSEVFLGGFVPTSVSGCQLWLDGADQTSASMTLSGSTVTVWRDKSGNANNASASGTPTQLASGVNFSGTQFFSIPGLAGAAVNTSFTFFIVEKLITSTSANQRFFGDVGYSTNAGLHTGYEIGTNYNQVKFGFYNDDLVVSSTFSGLNTQRVWTFRYQKGPGTKTVNLFGSVVGSNASNQLTSFSSPVLGQSLGGAYYQGIIYEALFFKGDITDLNMQKVEGFLAWKWGLNSSLPSSHPYFSASPTSAPGFPAALQNILAPPLTPLSVSGCQLWLDGADPAGTGTAPANGATVSTWVDKSGNGRNATAVVAGVYSSAQKSITFSGTNYYNSPYTAAPTTETLFIIFNLITNNGGFMISGAACGGRAAAMYSTDGRFAGGANCYTWGAISSSITTGSNTLGVVVTDGSSNYTSLHGALTLTGPTTGITYTSGVTTYIGAHSGPNYLTNGYICEVIAYNSILTVLQRQKVEGYLGWKWGLQTNLPPTHPYFSASPTIPITIAMTQPYPPALTRIFSYTGADQSYIVPSGTTSLTVYMWGAGGGGGYTGTGSLYGGAGAYLQGVLAVTPGATLTIIVGGGGVYRENIGGNTTSSYGGGGTAGAASGSGGGRSAIRVSGASDDLVTVGSGGGASYINTDNCYGGNGDSVTGTGGDSGISGIYYGGKGGTQSAGGIVGSGNSGSGGTAGSKYTGGNANVSAQSGGGGGSGYYGGGGGGYYTPGSGGGGGSSFTANLTSIVAINSPDRSTAPNTASPYYQTGVASGGATGLGGGNGLVVIVPNAPSLPFPTKVYTVSFTYTGSLQDFILPFGAYPATVYMWGAGGGYGDPGGASGGAGAYVTGKVSFVQGQTYKILVGGGAGYTTGGYGGGGNTGWGGSSGGGGRSAIQQPLGGILSSASGNGSVVTYTTSSSHGLVVGQPVIITGLTPSGYNGTFVVSTAPSLTTFTVSNTTSGASSGSGSILAELVDAGGGGGAATWTSTAGGGAAAYIGTASNGQSPGNNVQGLGGSQTAGGAAVSGGEGTGSAGGPLQGGSASGQGGGGGGGYYGGGGGASASYNHGGGGGGSSYTALLTNVSGANGSGGTAPGTTVTGYIAGVAAGGITSSRTGGNGLVIISYIGF